MLIHHCPSYSSFVQFLKIDHCDFPDGLHYDVDNPIWVKNSDGSLRIGITAILAWSSGNFFAVTFKPVGTEVAKGQILGSVEGPKHFDVVRSPVSGTVSALNERLRVEPELLNKDPYGAGWFSEIKPKDRSELGILKSAHEAQELIAKQLRERRVHCFTAFPDHELFEVGVECSAVLVMLNQLLAPSDEGTVVHIVSDDPTAEIEMQRWSDQTGNQVLESRKEGNLYHFIVKKRGRG